MSPELNVLGEALTGPPEADGRMAAITARAGYMMGRNVDRAWSPERAAAWEGFLELSRQLRRAAEGLLEPFGLSVSMLGVMGRLDRAEGRTLRQTELAHAMGLSVSRVSRLIDALERRELVQRRPCPADARATNVTLTRAGLRLARKAQDAVFGFVEEEFFVSLDDTTVETLADAFTTLLGRRQGDEGACA
jgi:DNA-binding MarR family transcriptional regulator